MIFLFANILPPEASFELLRVECASLDATSKASHAEQMPTSLKVRLWSLKFQGAAIQVDFMVSG